MTLAETFTPANESTPPRPTLNPHSLDIAPTNYRARYYSSNDARFMSPDWSSDPEAVPYAKLKNPQSLNLYEYMLDNPLGGVDKDGHACIFGVTVFGSWFGGRCPGSSTPAPPAATPQPPPPGAGQVGLDGVPPPAPLNANGTIACGCRQNTNQQQNNNQQRQQTGNSTGSSSASRLNKLRHIFNPKHNLELLVRRFGSQENAMKAIEKAASEQLGSNISGAPQIVDVDGYNVTVTGANTPSGPQVGNAWIPGPGNP